jgi:hypothetical protein
MCCYRGVCVVVFGSLAFGTGILKSDKGNGNEEYGKEKYKIKA